MCGNGFGMDMPLIQQEKQWMIRSETILLVSVPVEEGRLDTSLGMLVLPIGFELILHFAVTTLVSVWFEPQIYLSSRARKGRKYFIQTYKY